jgi:hypothetical protein
MLIQLIQQLAVDQEFLNGPKVFLLGEASTP